MCGDRAGRAVGSEGCRLGGLRLRVARITGTWVEISPGDPPRRRFGVPPGGPFDPLSWSLASCLGCQQGLELTCWGGERTAALEFESDGVVILAGHEGDADGVELPCLLPVRSGKVVEVSRRGRGFRLYACFLPGRSCTEPIRLASVLQPPAPLRCVPCPSWPSGIEQAGLTVMASIDRKGVQVSGWCQTGEAGLPSRPSVIGGIQLTPGGTLLIHGPDGPTTGGYEMLGAVIRADWPLLGQLSPGDPVRVVSVDQAEALRAWEKSLAVQRHERLKAALLERLTAR